MGAYDCGMAETVAAGLANRVHILNNKPVRPTGQYVLYWMQQSQRTVCNHALEGAVRKANELKLPVVVVFGLMDNYPEATERHYSFMLEGLRDVRATLEELGIKFVVLHATPVEAALRLAGDAAVMVADRGYLRHLRAWRDEVADKATCRVVEIETDVVVPVEVATDKSEIGARTLRPRIHRQWDSYIVPLRETKPKQSSLHLKIKSDWDVSKPEKILAEIGCIRGVKPTAHFTGGQVAAEGLLKAFITAKLAGYGEGRNEPAGDQSSRLSPYLQYGHISPLTMVLAARAANVPDADRDVFIEELVVRRELAHNFCWFNPKYDSFECLQNWAKQSLVKHTADNRPVLYTRDQLEKAATHDPYWNAAQLEMVKTGFMHNYMRMYWGKKILEWSATPQEAYATTLYFNNRYFLDGLNANSYGNVAWIYGQHDRPWGPERPIFGLIRYMNAAGLERKFEIDDYVKKVAAL